jgi:hypothetical protein
VDIRAGNRVILFTPVIHHCPQDTERPLVGLWVTGCLSTVRPQLFLGFYGRGKGGYLVINFSSLGHQVTYFVYGVNNCGVVTATELFGNRWVT